jgi:hypothetical protein
MRSTIGAGDKRGRDDAERALVAHEEQVRDGALRLEADAAQQHARQVADPVVARRKRQRVADDRPHDAHKSERHETHHHRVECVLRANESAVEEGEGRRHQQH